MAKKVDIIKEEQDYKKAIFEVIEAKLRHEKFDGTMTEEITRLNLERGDAVAAIVHNPADDKRNNPWVFLQNHLCDNRNN